MNSFQPYGLRFFGAIWLAEAVTHAYKHAGRDYVKREWRNTIRQAIQEAPKKHRQEWARVLAEQFKTAKRRGGVA